MSVQARLRRVARLESFVIPYLARLRQEDLQGPRLMLGAHRAQLANIALLSLYGKPRLTESLEHAWRRCREASAWKTCQQRYPAFDWYGRRDDASPFDGFSSRHIADCFEKHILPGLPGADESEKYELIFRRAPLWLIWFSYCDLHASIFGIKLPDLSSVSCFVRDKEFALRMPKGPFECRPWPDGVHDEFADGKESKKIVKTEGMTSRERKRLLRIFAESDFDIE